MTSKASDAEWFEGDLARLNCDRPVVAKTCGDARRMMVERTFDLCIVNAPLQDENGVRFSADVIGTRASQVILLVKREYADEIASRVEDCGVFTVEKPLMRGAFWTALKMTSAAFNRTSSMQNENARLRQRISELKTVNRAKCLLIERENLTEEEAHREMEKTAMDSRISKAELARRIIERYED